MTFSQLKEGSARFEGGVLTECLEKYGATLATQSTLSYSVVTLYCLHRHLHDIVNIVSSMLLEPTFPEDKFALALSQSRTKWQIQHQQVATLCREESYRQLYGGEHPMGRFPTLADYDTLTTQHLRDFYQRYVSPSYATILLTGRFDDKDLCLFDDYLGADDKVSHAHFIYPPVQPVTYSNRNQHIRTEQGYVQAAVRMGRLLPSAGHPDMPLLKLAVTVLGGYFGSRLMTNIREQRGLTYGIGATIYNVPHDSALVIACETATQYVDEVVSQVRVELQRLCDEPVGEAELQMVKNYLMGQNCRRYERSFNYPSVLLNLLATSRTPDDIEREQQIQQQASPADLIEVARRWFRPDDFCQCIVS